MFYADVETVTPQMASDWLSRNPQNRTLSKRHAERLAEDMSKGNFVYNGESIKIDEEGNLLDGQHRLTAIVMSGTVQQVLVARDVPRSSMRTIDRGHGRTVADWLKIRGYPNYTILGGAARMLHIFEQGALQRSNATGKFHPSDADSVLERHPGLTKSVTYTMMHREGMKRVYRSDANVAFLHYIFSCVDSSHADAFIEGLATGTSLSSGSAILHLRARLQDDLVDTRKKLTPVSRLAFVLKAWRQFHTGRVTKRLKYNVGESFPLVEGFTYKDGVPVFPR